MRSSAFSLLFLVMTSNSFAMLPAGWTLECRTTLSTGPQAPVTTAHPMNGNMGDFNSVMNGGSTSNLRVANEARSNAIAGSLSQAQALQSYAQNLVFYNQQQAQVSPPFAATELPTVDELLRTAPRHTNQPIDLASIPNPQESDLPYQFHSAPGEFRRELVQQYADLYKINPRGFKRETAKELGLLSTQSADQSYVAGDLQEATLFKEIGKAFLDIAVGLDPATGLGRSTFELFTGRNLITGAQLSAIERSFAFLGVATLGGANTARAVTRMFHVFDGAGRLLRERAAFQVAIHEGLVLYDRVGHLLPGFTKNGKILNIHTAEQINTAKFSHWPDTPPFQLGSHVVEFKTLRESQWVRVHTGSNETGNWIMRKSSIVGLTSHEIQIKYALPSLPTYVSDVHVPGGTTILRGNIQNHGLGGQGILQYYIDLTRDELRRVDWFRNMRSL